jgi:poly-gamma-glutamate capsule biosynthesis protein CapA/YwtB (metallophosphatase superfamily)
VIRLGLVGDTMLGRKVAEALRERPPDELVSPGVRDALAACDLVVANLECCISERGSPWPDPHKPFFFRAPPQAVAFLQHLGVACVTVANNHALDFGADALADTLHLLSEAGITAVGAGADEAAARRPAVVHVDGFRLRVIGVTDHPRDFAAGPATPGVAFADLRTEIPNWVLDAVTADGADAVLVTPHWGPNMTPQPVPHVRRAATALVGAGATLVAGHSAHVFHGVASPVLYDLGDFIDDYAVDPRLRNDLGLLFLVDLDADGPHRIEAVPLALDYCHTRLADADETRWIARRFADACSALGTEVSVEDGRLVVVPPSR